MTSLAPHAPVLAPPALQAECFFASPHIDNPRQAHPRPSWSSFVASVPLSLYRPADRPAHGIPSHKCWTFLSEIEGRQRLRGSESIFSVNSAVLSKFYPCYLLTARLLSIPVIQQADILRPVNAFHPSSASESKAEIDRDHSIRPASHPWKAFDKT